MEKGNSQICGGITSRGKKGFLFSKFLSLESCFQFQQKLVSCRFSVFVVLTLCCAKCRILAANTRKQPQIAADNCEQTGPISITVCNKTNKHNSLQQHRILKFRSPSEKALQSVVFVLEAFGAKLTDDILTKKFLLIRKELKPCIRREVEAFFFGCV